MLKVTLSTPFANFQAYQGRFLSTRRNSSSSRSASPAITRQMSDYSVTSPKADAPSDTEKIFVCLHERASLINAEVVASRVSESLNGVVLTERLSEILNLIDCIQSTFVKLSRLHRLCENPTATDRLFQTLAVCKSDLGTLRAWVKGHNQASKQRNMDEH